MKTQSTVIPAWVWLGLLGMLSLVLSCHGQAGHTLPTADGPPSKRTEPIPWDQIGAKAGADYKGDGFSVTPTATGAKLNCIFQRLEGEATGTGLWLTSTVANQTEDRFRVMAVGVGRQAGARDSVRSLTSLGGGEPADAGCCKLKKMATAGNVSVDGQSVRFTRPGLIEEYTVSMDGVRQDFVVLERPDFSLTSSLCPSCLRSTAPEVGSEEERMAWRPDEGALRLELEVSGARIEPLVNGARLGLEGSRRKIAYSRLRVTDATGKELSARMEAGETPASSLQPPALAMAIVVDDTDAVYPVRIDPTFSDANWISMSPSIPGADYIVAAAVVDGSGNLYIGGEFTVVGDVFANRVAKWDGSRWSALGSGIGGVQPWVSALAVSGSDVYAAGFFTTAGGVETNNIAKWNGSSWSVLGSGTGGQSPWVYSLAVSGNDVYAGGLFTTAGGVVANNVAKWNGSGWSALGSGMGGGRGFFPHVSALAVSGSDVYAGGGFTTAGGVEVNRIAKWDGSGWSALGSGMEGAILPSVYALAVSGSDLYAAGGFTKAGGVDVNGIAKWNGSSWSALGSGMDGLLVQALAVSGSDVYAGNVFTTAGGVEAIGVAKWNGSSWSPLGSGMGGASALAVLGGDVYAGGGFTTAGGVAASRIAKWDGSGWSALGSGMNDIVSALAVSGSDVYAGGGFTTVGGVEANYVAKWSGSGWSPLGSGMDFPVQALAVLGSDLYTGGEFTTAGGVEANYVAKWNGSSWSALGSEKLNGEVLALAVSGGDVYAGGYFTTAGGVQANSVAKWNGSSWSALDLGMGGDGGFNSPYVSALAVSGSDVYAGGFFTTAGGVQANGIAKWNGSSWSPLGSGIERIGNFNVSALAVSGSDVYAGGEFTTAGGVEANGIAKWNGSSWSPLGSGLGGVHFPSVYALAVLGSDVYAGGYFTTAGGVAANGIAKWNGSGWSVLGSGMGGLQPWVHALAVSGSDLYAGGEFTTAGGKLSAYLARAYLIAPPGGIADSIAFSSGTATIRFYGNPGHLFDVQRATDLSNWPTVSTSPLAPAPDGSFTFVDPNAPPGHAYYRASER